MYVYLIAIFTLIFLFLYDNGRNDSKLGNIALVLLFVVVAGHNGQMNCDYIHYLRFVRGNGYSMYGTLDMPEDIEIGYIIFAKIINRIITADFEYIILWGLIISIPFAVLVKRFSNNVILSVLLLMILNNGRNFMTFFCAHRQMLSVSMLFVALIVAEKKVKFWKFICLSICIASFYVHSTVFFFMPILILLYYVKISDNRIYYYGALVSLAISQFVNLSNQFSNWAQTLSLIFPENRAIDHLEDSYSDLSIWQYLPFTLLFVVFVYYYHKENLNNYFLKCFFAAVVFKNLFGFFPHIARSIFIFCLFAVIGAIPKSETQKTKYETQRKIYIIVIMMCVYLEYRVLASFNPNVNYWCLPYNFIWE